jgi:hypothetical protein
MLTCRVVRTEFPIADSSGFDGVSEMSALQGAFTQIRDSVQKVVLPTKFAMTEYGPGIKPEYRKTLALIRKTSSFTTTMLKLMKLSGEKPHPSESDWDLMYTCLITLHKTIQSEQIGAIFEGKGVPDDTMTMYRFLSKNSAIDRSETIALENATRLTSAIHEAKKQGKSNDTSQRGGYRGNRFNSNFRGRGGNRNF